MSKFAAKKPHRDLQSKFGGPGFRSTHVQQVRQKSGHWRTTDGVKHEVTVTRVAPTFKPLSRQEKLRRLAA